MIRSLTYYGDKVLRTKCEPVGEVTPEVLDLAQDLIDTMEEMKGAGLAAPQIGVLKRMFVCCYVGDDKEGSPVIGDPFVVIDPIINVTSNKEQIESEGCLSIPGLHGNVLRPFDIEIEYTNLEGKRVKDLASGWKARCILHENDHINGVLYIDRLEKTERQQLEPRLRLIKKKYS